MEQVSSLVKSKVKELRNLKDSLYSGEISAREYQDKEKEIKDEVNKKEGIKGILSLNKEIRKLEMTYYAPDY
jgi:hypothetical protein